MLEEFDTVVLYHANCMDGMGAAWATQRGLEKNFPEVVATFIPVNYGYEVPTECNDKHVIIVDFSFPAAEIAELSKRCKSVVILDHHKTAQEALSGLDYLDYAYHKVRDMGLCQARFNMEESGAMLAWNYFNQGDAAPRIIEIIQDRDLWKFELPHTKEVHAALSSWPGDLEEWSYLLENTGRDEMVTQGSAILRKQQKDIDSMIAASCRDRDIAGHIVPCVNIPPMWASDACHILAQGRPFAAAYYDTKKGRSFSLRSEPDGMDVSEIAKGFGGGGHKHAAGFNIPNGKLGVLIDWV